MRALRPYLERERPTAILVGLPLTDEGVVGEMAERVLDLVDFLATRTGLPVHTWDERMTTARALADARATGRRISAKDDVDALAATVLLQHYLDRPSEAR